MSTQFFTDGTRLYEIASQRTVENYGLRRGTITYTILRDCVTGETAAMHELDLAALTEVKRAA